MNRIDRKLEELKKNDQKALITFITAGDPDLETTEKLVLEMINAGVDIIELGVPFSDPVAEGPVIQAASQRALEGGTKLVDIFECVERLREKTDTPILLMMYINSLFKYGKDNFFRDCQEKGIDGVIVPDLPFEERGEIEEEAHKYSIHIINLIAPTSGKRIEKIAKESTGFIYCVSSLGVTGERSSFLTDFEDFLGNVKKYSKVPAMIGFGISNSEQVKELKKYSDGVIVGSAVVKIVGEYGRASAPQVYEFVHSLKNELIHK